MTRSRILAPLMAAVALVGVALATVRGAGCDDPGYLAPVDGGYELVGGCVAAGDLVVSEPPAGDPAQTADAERG